MVPYMIDIHLDTTQRIVFSVSAKIPFQSMSAMHQRSFVFSHVLQTIPPPTKLPRLPAMVLLEYLL